MGNLLPPTSTPRRRARCPWEEYDNHFGTFIILIMWYKRLFQLYTVSARQASTWIECLSRISPSSFVPKRLSTPESIAQKWRTFLEHASQHHTECSVFTWMIWLNCFLSFYCCCLLPILSSHLENTWTDEAEIIGIASLIDRFQAMNIIMIIKKLTTYQQKGKKVIRLSPFAIQLTLTFLFRLGQIQFIDVYLSNAHTRARTQGAFSIESFNCWRKFHFPQHILWMNLTPLALCFVYFFSLLISCCIAPIDSSSWMKTGRKKSLALN